MQSTFAHLLPISEIEERAKRLHLSLFRLSRAAGVNPSTAWAGRRGRRDSRISTTQRLQDELIREELALRDHLLRLHPVASDASRAA